jgi:hypothetical protein
MEALLVVSEATQVTGGAGGVARDTHRTSSTSTSTSGHKNQTIELGGIAVMAFKNAMCQTAATELGLLRRDPKAPWRAEANKRIDQYRKENLRVLVRDAAASRCPMPVFTSR